MNFTLLIILFTYIIGAFTIGRWMGIKSIQAWTKPTNKFLCQFLFKIGTKHYYTKQCLIVDINEDNGHAYTSALMDKTIFHSNEYQNLCEGKTGVSWSFIQGSINSCTRYVMITMLIWPFRLLASLCTYIPFTIYEIIELVVKLFWNKVIYNMLYQTVRNSIREALITKNAE